MEKLMSTEELAEYLQIPLGTIYQWSRRNTGPKRYKVGIHTRFRASEVEAWLETQAVGNERKIEVHR